MMKQLISLALLIVLCIPVYDQLYRLQLRCNIQRGTSKEYIKHFVSSEYQDYALSIANGK